MRIISISDKGVTDIRRTHQAFKKAGSLLGFGSFCGVFAMDDPNRVLKLTADKQHMCYLTDYIAPQGRFKPVVLADYGDVGQSADGLPLYLLEVEKLQPIRRGTANGKLARKLINFARKHGRLPDDEDDGGISGVSDEMLRFMRDLNWFVTNYQCALDLQWSNFMERPDGTLVFSDPVFDSEVYEKFYRRRYWR